MALQFGAAHTPARGVRGGLHWGLRAGSVVALNDQDAVTRTLNGPKGRLYYGDAGVVVASGAAAWVTDGGSHLWRIAAPDGPLVEVATYSYDKAISMCPDGTGGVWVVLFNAARVLHYA